MSEKDGGYHKIAFKQVGFDERIVFIKTYYSRYDSGNMGYFSMSNLYMVEYKDGEWLNLENELPQRWKKNYNIAVVNADKNEFSLYKIDFDKNTGKELKRELIETAEWTNGKFTVTNTFIEQKNNKYKIIVAYAISEDVSEDWNYVYSDIKTAFQDKGIYTVVNSGSIASVDNADLSIEIDLTEILESNKDKGNFYIFLENDKEAKCVDYDVSDAVIKQAKEYFGQE